MLAAAEYTGSNLVFIVGCPRSGTTWLQRLLAGHPQIRTGQETHLFYSNIGPQLREFRQRLDPTYRGGVGLGCYFAEEEFVGILKSFLVRLLEPMVGSLPPGELFLEKTPGHALFLPEIVELLPRCRIVHVLRDPRDVVASLVAAARSWGEAWAPKDPLGAARLWTDHFRRARAAQQQLPAWQFHEIRYEDLHRSPEKALRDCVSFLGLTWEEASLREALGANAPERLIAGQAGTTIPLRGEASRRSGAAVRDPPGFIRKAAIGGWKKEFSVRDRLVMWRALRKPMAEAGYKWPFFLLS